MRGTLLILLFLSLAFQGRATGDSLNYLTPKDTIFISLGNQGDKIFTHYMAPKQTLYSLAKFYGLSLTDLYLYNPGIKDSDISVGQGIKIPIPNRAIIRYKGDEFDNQNHVPVCYVIKKGDTLYKISKNYFRMPMDTIKARNGMPDNTIHVGQPLQIGWMNIEGIPDSLRVFQGGPLWRKSYDLSKTYQSQSEGKSEKEDRGIATWQKDKVYSGQELFVLHRDAPVNSVVAITNPMSRRTVYCTVIGSVPNFYEPGVVVLLTPTVAEMLGAIDQRFFVTVRYFP